MVSVVTNEAVLSGEGQIAEVEAGWVLAAVARVLDAVMVGEGQTASEVDVTVVGEGRRSRCAHGEHMVSVFFFAAHFLCVDSRHIWQVKLLALVLGVWQW